MTIELQSIEQRTITALQSKIQDVKVRAEAAIAAYQDALGTVFSAIIRERGGEGNYQLNATGTALVQVEVPPQQKKEG